MSTGTFTSVAKVEKDMRIAAASPALAALVVIAATRGRPGFADLLRSLVKWRVGLQWYFFALLGIPIVFLSTYSILYGAPLSKHCSSSGQSSSPRSCQRLSSPFL